MIQSSLSLSLNLKVSFYTDINTDQQVEVQVDFHFITHNGVIIKPSSCNTSAIIHVSRPQIPALLPKIISCNAIYFGAVWAATMHLPYIGSYRLRVENPF